MIQYLRLRTYLQQTFVPTGFRRIQVNSTQLYPKLWPRQECAARDRNKTYSDNLSVILYTYGRYYTSTLSSCACNTRSFELFRFVKGVLLFYLLNKMFSVDLKKMQYQDY